jgi:hypothetical protein
MHLDQTDSVHPEIAAMAMDATSIVGLDIAGLDVIALDLTKSPQEQDFVVLEVNSEPSIALHLEPLCTPSRPVGAAIVDALFPVPEAGRIPVIAVLGKAGDFPVARQVAMQQQAKLRHVGLASRDGSWLNDRPLGVPCQSVGKHTLIALRIGAEEQAAGVGARQEKKGRGVKLKALRVIVLPPINNFLTR